MLSSFVKIVEKHRGVPKHIKLICILFRYYLHLYIGLRYNPVMSPVGTCEKFERIMVTSCWPGLYIERMLFLFETHH